MVVLLLRVRGDPFWRHRTQDGAVTTFSTSTREELSGTARRSPRSPPGRPGSAGPCRRTRGSVPGKVRTSTGHARVGQRGGVREAVVAERVELRDHHDRGRQAGEVAVQRREPRVGDGRASGRCPTYCWSNHDHRVEVEEVAGRRSRRATGSRRASVGDRVDQQLSGERRRPRRASSARRSRRGCRRRCRRRRRAVRRRRGRRVTRRPSGWRRSRPRRRPATGAPGPAGSRRTRRPPRSRWRACGR